jgi:hypothetical protein
LKTLSFDRAVKQCRSWSIFGWVVSGLPKRIIFAKSGLDVVTPLDNNNNNNMPY